MKLCQVITQQEKKTGHEENLTQFSVYFQQIWTFLVKTFSFVLCVLSVYGSALDGIWLSVCGMNRICNGWPNSSAGCAVLCLSIGALLVSSSRRKHFKRPFPVQWKENIQFQYNISMYTLNSKWSSVCGFLQLIMRNAFKFKFLYICNTTGRYLGLVRHSIEEIRRAPSFIVKLSFCFFFIDCTPKMKSLLWWLLVSQVSFL